MTEVMRLKEIAGWAVVNTVRVTTGRPQGFIRKTTPGTFTAARTSDLNF